MNRFLKDQKGVAMMMVVAFMALSVPMITGALALSGSLSHDSTVKTEILKRQYAALGGDQFAGYISSRGFLCGDYSINLGELVTVATCDLPPELFPPPPADDSRRLFTSITVDRDWAPPADFTPPGPAVERFIYTVTVTNRDDEPEGLTKIHVILPPGFAFVSDSARFQGALFSDPAISGQKLTWNLANEKIVLQPAAPGVPAEFRVLSFWAEAIVTEGNYCTEAWADPGQIKTGTGLDAKIEVGAPADDLCVGPAVTVDKTSNLTGGTVVGTNPLGVVYTITMENRGTSDLTLSQIRDLLPPGFIYSPGSTGGDLGSNDPSTTVFQGRQRLDWAFSPEIVIPSGETREVTFRVNGAFTGGHWNDAWFTFGEFSDTRYTWPSAGITMKQKTYSDTSTASGAVICTQTWELEDSDPEDDYAFVQWDWKYLPDGDPADCQTS